MKSTIWMYTTSVKQYLNYNPDNQNFCIHMVEDNGQHVIRVHAKLPNVL